MSCIKIIKKYQCISLVITFMLFSIKSYAGPDYSLLTKQLNSAHFVSTFEKLKVLVKNDQAALIPLVQFLCIDYRTHKWEWGPVHARFGQVRNFIKQYTSFNGINESIVQSILAIKEGRGSNIVGGCNAPILVLDGFAKTQRFSDKIIYKLIDLANKQLIHDKNKKTGYTYTYLLIFKKQTIFRRLPKQIRTFAIKSMGTQFNFGGQLDYPAMDLLVSLLRYKDQKSEDYLIKQMQPRNSLKLRKYSTGILTSWYSTQKNPNAFVENVATLAEKERNNEMKQFYAKELYRIATKNKNIKIDLIERMVLLVGKKQEYSAIQILMKSYVAKSKHEPFTERQLKIVLKALKGNVHINNAVKVLVGLDKKNNINKTLHESLIKILFSPEYKVYQSPLFVSLVLDNVAYLNVKNYDGKYQNELLISVMEDATKYKDKRMVDNILEFMSKVNDLKVLPQKVVESLYKIHEEQNDYRVRTAYLAFFKKYKAQTGYEQYEVLIAGVRGRKNKKVAAVKIKKIKKNKSEDSFLKKLAKKYLHNDHPALIQALFNNDYALMESLLKKGANPDEHSYKMPGGHSAYSDHHTALTIAAANGDERVVRLLLRYKADRHEPTQNGETPLEWALHRYHLNAEKLNVAKILWEHAPHTGYESHATTAMLNTLYKEDYRTYQYFRSQLNHPLYAQNLFINLLRNAGRLDDKKQQQIIKLFDYLLKQGEKPGPEVLLIAMSSYSPEIIKILIDTGLNPNALIDKNVFDTDLMGMGKSNRGYYKKYQGNTVLMSFLSTQSGFDIAKKLIEYGADINALNSKGQNALMYFMSTTFTSKKHMSGFKEQMVDGLPKPSYLYNKVHSHVIRFYIENGSRTDIVDKQGRNIYQQINPDDYDASNKIKLIKEIIKKK